MEPLGAEVLPAGVRGRIVPVNGLAMHVLEAGFASPGRPAVLLLHGFPELAYSWRKIMPALAADGYYVVAPDQRGYGRTTGWSADYDADISSFRLLALARDMVELLAVLGLRRVAAVVGHDFGSPVAAWCALTRPDIFARVALMSAPFGGPPEVPGAAAAGDVHADLAALDPPRKHYQWYFSTRAANADMHAPPGGLPAFLRAYYHHKSGDWAGNEPFRLAAWSAADLAKLPTYYVMRRDATMPESVVAPARDPAWLTAAELAVYAGEYGRTGFQGGLNWYRCRTSGRDEAELGLFAGRRIEVPAMFVAGARDWGIFQVPGALERMRDACPRMGPPRLVPGAGHWVQQERPAEVLFHLRALLAEAA